MYQTQQLEQQSTVYKIHHKKGTASTMTKQQQQKQQQSTNSGKIGNNHPAQQQQTAGIKIAKTINQQNEKQNIKLFETKWQQ